MKVRRVSWNDVKVPLDETFEGDGNLIEHDVKIGEAFCWQIGECYAITRRDRDELVIICLAGKDIKSAGEAIVESARNAGCKSMRYHTKRPGLVKLLKEFGFKTDEFICKAEL